MSFGSFGLLAKLIKLRVLYGRCVKILRWSDCEKILVGLYVLFQVHWAGTIKVQ